MTLPFMHSLWNAWFILQNSTLFQTYHCLQTALCLGSLTEFNSTKLSYTLFNILFYTTYTNPNYVILKCFCPINYWFMNQLYSEIRILLGCLNLDILYRIFMLSYQTFIPELTSYIVVFKHWKTTSARRQTTSNRTSAFAISQQNMLSFQ